MCPCVCARVYIDMLVFLFITYTCIIVSSTAVLDSQVYIYITYTCIIYTHLCISVFQRVCMSECVRARVYRLAGISIYYVHMYTCVKHYCT